MNAKKWRSLILLPWASLPLVLISYVALWDRLPSRLAIHFGTSGNANGWMGRAESLLFDLIILLFVLVSYSVKLRGEESHANSKKLISYYLAVMIVTGVFLAVLKYNL